MADADILFDPQKHFYPWVWPFYNRLTRGDLTRPDVIRPIIQQAQQTGRFPKPPFLDPVSRLPDENELGEILMKAGYAAQPAPAPPPPRTDHEIVGGILSDLGFTEESAAIQRVDEGGKVHTLTQEEAAKMLGKKRKKNST